MPFGRRGRSAERIVLSESGVGDTALGRFSCMGALIILQKRVLISGLDSLFSDLDSRLPDLDSWKYRTSILGPPFSPQISTLHSRPQFSDPDCLLPDLNSRLSILDSGISGS